MPKMEQPKHILFCWDLITPVNYNLTLSFLFFPLPTFAPDTGSTEKFVSSEDRRRGKEEGEKKNQKRDKAQFSLPC